MNTRAHRLTASEADGVDYRRAATWQIALSQMNNGSAMIFFVLIGFMSYLQNGGYGIAVAVAGAILTVTRILDGLIDPVLSVFMDKVTLRFGKIRFFILLGWAVRTLAVLVLFVWGPDQGLGVLFFVLVYVVYIVGSSINDIAGNMVGPVLTNDPRQRPTVSVWSTAYSYLVPTVFTIVSTVVILPRYDNQFSVDMLRTTALVFVAASLVFTLLACVGVARADRPENFRHVAADGTGDLADEEKVAFRDMWSFLRGNHAFQRYVFSAAAEKLAQVVTAQAVVGTMLYGILIGNIQLGSIMSMAVMLPSLVFAIFGARYVGKHGSRRATIVWSWVCIVLLALSIVFCVVVDLGSVLGSLPLMIGFFGIQLALNGAKMCVTVANSAMRADVVDYELDRSGKYLPAVVTGTYNVIDQLVSSLGAAVALGAVALIGYSATMPQPTDSPTPQILGMTLLLMFGLPLIGFVVTVVVMRGYRLTRPEMVAVQRRIADRKAALLASHDAAPADVDVPAGA